MRDQEFRARDKVVQKMTRHGLTEKNLTKVTEKRISSREEDFSYKRTEEAGGRTAPGTRRGEGFGIASGRPKTQGSGQGSRESVGVTGEVYGVCTAGYPSENGDGRHPSQEQRREQRGENQPQTLNQSAHGRQYNGQNHRNPADENGGRGQENSDAGKQGNSENGQQAGRSRNCHPSDYLNPPCADYLRPILPPNK